MKDNILNRILINWDDSDIKQDSGILSKEDIKQSITVPTIEQIIEKLKTMLTELPEIGGRHYYVAPRSFKQICEIFKAFNPNIKVYWEYTNSTVPEGVKLYGISGIIKIGHPYSYQDPPTPVSSYIDYRIKGEKTFIEVPCLFCKLAPDENWNILYGLVKNGEWYHSGWTSMENNYYNNVNGTEVWAMRENSCLKTFAIYIQGILKIYADPSSLYKNKINEALVEWNDSPEDNQNNLLDVSGEDLDEQWDLEDIADIISLWIKGECYTGNVRHALKKISQYIINKLGNGEIFKNDDYDFDDTEWADDMYNLIWEYNDSLWTKVYVDMHKYCIRLAIFIDRLWTDDRWGIDMFRLAADIIMGRIEPIKDLEKIIIKGGRGRKLLFDKFYDRYSVNWEEDFIWKVLIGHTPQEFIANKKL